MESLLGAALPLERGGDHDAEAYRIEPDGDGWVLVHSPHRPEIRRVTVTEVADALVAEFTHLRLLEGGGCALHAGVVDHGGRGIVAMGPSGAGKSTTVAHLVHAGASLVNDELVVVDRSHGLVEGFRRPIAIDPDGHEVLSRLTDARPPTPDGRWLVRPETLGGRWALTSRPALLVELRRRDGPVDCTPLDAGMAFDLLCANNLDLVRDVSAGLEAFAWLAATVPCVRLEYEEAVDAVPVVLDAVVVLPGPGIDWQVVAPSRDAVAPDSWRGRLNDEVHSIVLGDRVVLYVPRTRAVIRLDPAGGHSWAELGRRRRPRRRERALIAHLRQLGVGS